MTLEDLRDLFYAGYDDKARIDLSTGLGEEFLENIRINDPKLDPYLNCKVVGLVHLYKTIEVSIER
jgi:hypothetical protein